MGRERNRLNVTEAEREQIRELYRAGVRVEEIVKRMGRGVLFVYRAVRGIERKPPAPERSAATARRNRLIAQRAVKEGVPQVDRFGAL